MLLTASPAQDKAGLESAHPLHLGNVISGLRGFSATIHHSALRAWATHALHLLVHGGLLAHRAPHSSPSHAPRATLVPPRTTHASTVGKALLKLPTRDLVKAGLALLF